MATAKEKSKVERVTLTVRQRPATGTLVSRRLRRSGWVPASVYGRTAEPLSIAVEQAALLQLLRSGVGEHALLDLTVEADPEGKAKAAKKPVQRTVLVKDVQLDPVDGHVVHVDFHAISLTERIRVPVPVQLKGEPVGVKQDGGIMEHFLREVEVECLPTAIPAGIEYDISAMKIGDALHVSDLTAPEGSKILSDPEGVVLSVQAPKEEKPEEAPAAAEPEVIREKKDEGEKTEAEPAKAEGKPAKAEDKGEKGAKS